MTELIITPNYDKKTARFKGTIAGGESVKVTIVGAANWLSDGLRLRVVCGCARTVAMFPLKSEDGAVSSFEVEGEDLIAAPLELNTIQARLHTQGFAATTATFIVEDLEKNILYFQDSYELRGWVKRCGDEEPYDLTKFPRLIEDWARQIENLIVDAKEVDGGIEVTVCNGVSPAKTFIIRNGRDGQPGDPGRKGDDGKSLTFNDLTEAQKAELKGPKGDTGEGITDELKALLDKAAENTQAIETNRVAINTEENRAKGAEKELLTRIEESKANAAAAMTAASKAQDTADKTVTEIATLVGDDAGDKRKSARTIAAEEVAKVVASAPADLDTLKEIADYIESDKTGAAQMVTRIDANAKAISAEEKRAQEAEAQLKKEVDELDAAKANKTALEAEVTRAKGAEAALGEEIAKKVDAEDGKGLSTNDYTKEDKEKLGKAYSPDNPPPTPDLSDYAKTDDVWLRGNDVTGETNFAQSIKVNEIESLDDESGIKFGAPIVSNTVNYGGENEPAFAVIEGNMIQAFSYEGDSSSDLIIRGRSFQFQSNAYENPDAPPPEIQTEGDILCNGDIYSNIHYLFHGGALIFNSYDEWGFPNDFYLNAIEVEKLLSNSSYIQENLRDHITHGMRWDDLYGSELGTVTITPTDEYGGYSEFYFNTNGNLSMSGALRATEIFCDNYVACYDISATSGIYANSTIEEWGAMGGVQVGDMNYPNRYSKLLAGELYIEDSSYDTYVDINVNDGLSLSFFYQDELLTFSFSDFVTLREMIDNFRASQGA